jgi:hypothetical protein
MVYKSMSEKELKSTGKVLDKKLLNYLIKDSRKLVNDGERLDVSEIVHPLCYSYDEKKHPDMRLIPPWYKKYDKELKDLYFKTK